MEAETPSFEGPSCPIPLPHRERILMGHGSGGKMSHDLITQVFNPPFSNSVLDQGDDSGVVSVLPRNSLASTWNGRLAISTDSHVVWPLFFAGGDIGKLAVCGTVNDVAMMGAEPLFLTAGFILEEGLDIDLLQKVVSSMQAAAQEAGVTIIAGDTKVVQKGKADSLYINTTGVGILPEGIEISGKNAQVGDVVILSGPIGAHGMAVLEARQELGFESEIQSDVAPLNHLVHEMLNQSHRIHVLRDPTRGGLATTLNEIAQQSHVSILIDEMAIPVDPAVAMACEMLGFDPLYVANEGKLVAIVEKNDSPKVLEAMRQSTYGRGAVIIGEIQCDPRGRVLMRTTFGSTRVMDMPSGELLPRIC